MAQKMRTSEPMASARPSSVAASNGECNSCTSGVPVPVPAPSPATPSALVDVGDERDEGEQRCANEERCEMAASGVQAKREIVNLSRKSSGA